MNVSQKWQEVYLEATRYLYYAEGVHTGLSILYVFIAHVSNVHIVSYLQYNSGEDSSYVNCQHDNNKFEDTTYNRICWLSCSGSFRARCRNARHC